MKQNSTPFIPLTATNSKPFTPEAAETKTDAAASNPFCMTSVREFKPAPQLTLTTQSQSFTAPQSNFEEMNENELMTRISVNKKYKRNICKNWSESGTCAYGTKCQYAHGYDELHVVDKLTEEQLKAHDLFKTQNCRSFHKDMFCWFGRRCQWRHEHRTFQKVHRHFYISRLASLQYSAEDILEQSASAQEEARWETCTMTEASSDSSFIESEESFSKEFGNMTAPAVNEHRLSVFESITAKDSQICDKSSDEQQKALESDETSFPPFTFTKMSKSISFTPSGARASFDSLSKCSLETTV